MPRFLLDTNICIYMMKAPPSALAARFDKEQDGLAVSSITLAELLYGAANSARPKRNREGINLFLQAVDVLDFDGKAAEHFGDLKAELRRRGTLVGPLDMLIAAHARSLSLVVVTNNRREFDRIPGLKVENWVA